MKTKPAEEKKDEKKADPAAKKPDAPEKKADGAEKKKQNEK